MGQIIEAGTVRNHTFFPSLISPDIHAVAVYFSWNVRLALECRLGHWYFLQSLNRLKNCPKQSLLPN